jgi:hypothetical protein
MIDLDYDEEITVGGRGLSPRARWNPLETTIIHEMTGARESFVTGCVSQRIQILEGS